MVHPVIHSILRAKDKNEELQTGRIAKERLKRILMTEEMCTDAQELQQMEYELKKILDKYLPDEDLDIIIQIRSNENKTQGRKHVKTIQIKRL